MLCLFIYPREVKEKSKRLEGAKKPTHIKCANSITMSGDMNYKRLCKEDFGQFSCTDMARYLLNKVLVRKLNDGTTLKGRIVETECYLGGEDKASHSYGGRQTLRNEPMYMPAGTSYVYMTYGMYYCFNISTIEPGAAVLIRALEPIQGLNIMEKFRAVKKQVNAKPLKATQLCNGPAKLCMAMNITKDNCNKIDLCTSNNMWIEEPDDDNKDKDMKVVTSSRIGIASAGMEWATKPLRFYVLSNPHVSKRDRTAEKNLL